MRMFERKGFHKMGASKKCTWPLTEAAGMPRADRGHRGLGPGREVMLLFLVREQQPDLHLLVVSIPYLRPR